MNPATGLRTLRRLAFLILALSLPPMFPADAAAAAAPLRVLTLNIYHDKADWPARRARIIEGIRALDPDVVALQEVLQHEDLRNQARDLAEALGYQAHFFTVDPVGAPKRYGNALLTRDPVLHVASRALPPDSDGRVAGRVDIAVGTRRYAMVVTHLHHTPEGGAIRAEQLGDLMTWLDATAAGVPVVLMGDFNAPSDEAVFARVHEGFVESYASLHRGADLARTTLNPAFFDAGSQKRIDHVFAQRDAFDVREARIVLDAPDAAGTWPSDHFGLLATLVPRPLPDVARPWEQRALAPDARARALVAAMTEDEKFRLIRSDFGLGVDGGPRPEGALGSAGYTPAIARLGIPALQLADAGLGVTNPANIRPGDYATPMPSGPMTASTWSPAIAYAGGATMGRQAWRKGFNVLLAGSVNLQRDPRNGRNFEYAGEDPLLAGTLVGASVEGIQDQHVVSTLKHFALNDMETGRNTHSAGIGARAMHESDLLAFRVAMEAEEPGAVMSAYNRINGTYAGEHAELLDRVLKRDWGFGGWVLSDWGGAHSAAKAANAGLDQQSAGEVFDKQVWFDRPLREAIAAGEVAPARLNDMATRILRGLIATGAFDHPPQIGAIDVEADEAVAQRTAEAGIVLLHNRDGLLPLSKDVRRVLVVGGHADRGVIAGGGSSAVLGRGGNAVEGIAPTTWPGPVVFHPSSPLAALRALLPQAEVRFVDGRDLRDAARAAGEVDAVVVFATQWSAESVDLPHMDLPHGQDALIAAVAQANPHTAVVLETNGPVRMPWRDDVGAVLEAWYPGIRGGEAVARVLLGEVNPSGRLPVTWPVGLEQLPRPTVPGLGFDPPQPAGDTIDYTIEGANVGYRWFAAQDLEPLYPFGHGLSYTEFTYDDFRVRVLGPDVWAYFSVANTGARRGADVPQLYLELPEGHPTPVRLAGWQRIELDPGERREVAVRLSPHALADYDPDARRWHIAGGRYGVRLARSAGDAGEVRDIELPSRTLELRIGSAPTAAP